MASLRRVYQHRYFVLLWCVAESLLLSAIIHGWASIVVVFKKESFFRHLCDTHEPNATTTALDSSCLEQDERLNLVFTVGVFTFSSCGVFAGTFLDYLGPRKTRLLSCFLFVLSCLFFGLSDKDRPNLLFPGVITLASAGLTIFLTVIQVANMFSKWKSSVISLINGAVDSSAIMLLLFKLVYEGGIPLQWIFVFFLLVAVTFIFAFTFVLPPHTITTERVKVLREDTVSEKPHETGNKSIKDNPPLNKPLLENESSIVNEASKDCEQNAKGKQSLYKDLHEAPLCEAEAVDLEEDGVYIDPKVLHAAPTSLLKIMKSPEYILLVINLAVHTLRLWFYVGSLNSYLEYKSHNDIGIINQYTNWFGITQFAGFIFAPVVGFVMDWKPKSKKNKDSDIGFVVGFSLTNFTSLLLNILVLIPDLRVQYVSFVIQVVLRAFAYATFGSFLLHKFPMVHYGKLYGIGNIISGIFGCLQYPLFIINEGTLKKDPFWINIGLLVLCLMLFVLPAYLWLKESKEERNPSTVSNNQIQA